MSSLNPPDHRRNPFAGFKSRALSKFRQFFYGVGGVIFDHPFWFITTSSIVAILCGISFTKIQFETSVDKLYALPASQARADLAKQTALFGAPPRISMVFIVNQPNNSTNVLTKPVLRKLANLDKFLHHKMASLEGFTFEDVCYRQEMQFDSSSGNNLPPPAADAAQCMKMTPLDLYRTENLFGTPIVTRNWPYVPNLTKNKIVKADLALTDTNVQHLPSGTSKIFGASGFLLLYHASGENDMLEKSLAWEQAMIDFINHDIKPFSAIDPTQPGPAPSATTIGADGKPRLRDDEFMFPEFTDHDWQDFRVFVNAERSWQDELARSTMFDARLIRDYVIAFVIIAIYMVVCNRTSNPIRSKSFCGFLGSVSALFGYAAGGGICYWLGMKHCPTMHASPFLVLAIGLDNTFVVLNFYTFSYGKVLTPRERCQSALTESGLALFITTFTSVLSFAVGALGPYTAVRNFCIQTGMGLCGGFVYNIVFFYPCLCLEARAESVNRIFFLPDRITSKWLNRLPPQHAQYQPIADEVRAGYVSDESTRMATMSVQTVEGGIASAELFQAHKRTATVPAPEANVLPMTGSPNQLDTPVVLLHPRKTVSDVGNTSLVFSPPGDLSGEPLGSDPSVAVVQPDCSLEIERPTRVPLSLARFVQTRNMFEVASLQWQFASRYKAINAEVAKRDLDLSGEILDDARSALPTNVPHSTHEWATMPPAEMLNCDLKTSHQATELGLRLLQEPHGNKGKRTRRLLMRWFGPALTNPYVQKALIVAMFAYIVFFCTSAFKHLTAGLELENLSPPDSYLREAFAVSHNKFPIFPKQTFVLFTSPEVESAGAAFDARLDNFASIEYGATGGDVASWVTGKNLNQKPVSDYVESLGEIKWWNKSTLYGLMQLDARLRSMTEVQDILNGMMLFYEEHGVDVFRDESTTSEETRKQVFYRSLDSWLRHGVVGQHVRDQFKFATTAKQHEMIGLSPTHSIPPLLGFRIMIFNYNFLNSFSQSHYMLAIRDVVKEFSQSVWAGRNVLDDEQKDLVPGQEPIAVVRAEPKAAELEAQQLLDAPYPQYEQLLEKILPSAAARQASVSSESTSQTAPGFVAQVFMDTFLFFETDATIWRTTGLNMVTAFVSILLASSILMEGWSSVALVTAMILSVDIGVFGGMALLGLQLNILTMILLVLSIGFSVDYTVHVIHTFCHTAGKDPNARAVETMILICSPMTHGALSTLLGILPIYFRKEYVLQNFFWMMALVILFGFLNGVIFLPVLMAKSRQLLVSKAAAKPSTSDSHTGEIQFDQITSLLLQAVIAERATETSTTETLPKLRHAAATPPIPATPPHTTAETLLGGA